MISISALVHVVLALIIGGLIVGILHWAIDAAGTPQPYNRVAKVILIVLTVLILCGALLGMISVKPILVP